MADAPLTEEPIADEPAPDEHAQTMAAIDAALAPAAKNHERLGAVGFGDLQALLSGIRQAISVLVYGPPETPTGESVDAHGDAIRARQAQALADAQRPADEQAAVFEGGPLATTDADGKPAAELS